MFDGLEAFAKLFRERPVWLAGSLGHKRFMTRYKEYSHPYIYIPILQAWQMNIWPCSLERRDEKQFDESDKLVASVLRSKSALSLVSFVEHNGQLVCLSDS